MYSIILMAAIVCGWILTVTDTGLVVLPVPFTPQVPRGQWYEPWQNACEETSIAMVNAYYSGTKFSTATAEKQVLEIIQSKEKLFGPSLDESVDDMVVLIEKKFSWRARVVRDAGIAEIKKEITAGRPVIAPIDVRAVPSARIPGSQVRYHLIVIIGFDDARNVFVVNDPGFSFGKAITYPYTELMEGNEAYTVRDTRERRGRELIFTNGNNVVVRSLRQFWD